MTSKNKRGKRQVKETVTKPAAAGTWGQKLKNGVIAVVNSDPGKAVIAGFFFTGGGIIMKAIAPSIQSGFKSITSRTSALEANTALAATKKGK